MITSSSQETGHIKLASLKKIALANLNHLAELCDATPCGVEQLASQGVECQINTNTVGFAHHTLIETGISRVEDSVSGNAVGISQQLDFVFVGNSRVDFCPYHLGEVDRSDSNTATSAMNQDGLDRIDVKTYLGIFIARKLTCPFERLPTFINASMVVTYTAGIVAASS